MLTTPKGLSDEKAARMMTALREGRTLRKFGVKAARLESYFKLHREYEREALPLIAANQKAAIKRKGAIWRERTRTMCLKGLHSMTSENVLIEIAGRRRCKECRKIARDNPPPIDPALIDSIKRALQGGASIGQICWGKPVGGGKTDRSLILIGSNRFYHLRKIDRTFDAIVAEAIADSNAVGQTIRWSRIKSRMRTSAVRNEINDYQAIRALLPAAFPDKDDVISAIFEDLLTGALKRENVRGRVQTYIAEHNRMFPPKYAKFGDSPLVSLDEVMFEDESMTRGDTVSRGLWD